MKIVAINTVDYGSTGRIMRGIAEYARQAGHEYYTFSIGHKDGRKPMEGHQYYLSYLGNMIHYVLGRATGANGFFSIVPTLRLIMQFRKLQPDIIHVHNIHAFCIHIPILMFGIKRFCNNTVWTFHDCWPFTGHCPHYEMIDCMKWRKGCSGCPLYKKYPESFPDNSRWMWKYKKKNFSKIQNLIIVTPSEWLKNQVKQSFLGGTEVQTIHNGIDSTIFKPTTSDFKKIHHLENKKVILGVALGWDETKGLDVFQELARALPDDYVIVIVGTTDKTDNILDPKIISIHKTSDQKELAGIYSIADVFVNPTRQDTFPTVNIEALACGTPVITFKTGGSPEIIDESCGLVIEKDDITSLEEAIVSVCRDKPFSSADCMRRAAVFSAENSFSAYIDLYETIRKKKRVP